MSGALPERRRLVVAITGATGAIYGVSLVRHLAACPDIETHLIVSTWGKRTLELETDCTIEGLSRYCRRVYEPDDQAAPISSGSFGVHGTVIVPCSMKTLAAVASGYAADLIARAADVALKERRPLLLVVRESPLSSIHIRNMLTVSEAGGVIFPPMPAFYGRPRSLEEVVNHTVGRLMIHLGIANEVGFRWSGPPPTST